MKEGYIEKNQHEDSESATNAVRIEIKNAVEQLLGSTVSEHDFDANALDEGDLKIWAQYARFRDQAETAIINRDQWNAFLIDFQNYKIKNERNVDKSMFVEAMFQGVADLMEKTELHPDTSVSDEIKKRLEAISHQQHNEVAMTRRKTDRIEIQQYVDPELEQKIKNLQEKHPHLDLKNRSFGPPSEEEFQEQLKKEAEKALKDAEPDSTLVN